MQLTGLNCAGCAGRAERALQAVPGVQGASVNFATATATIEADRALSIAPLVQAVKGAGYPFAEHEVTLALSGMNCGSCVGRVEAALGALDGVLSVTVTLTDGMARVRYVAGIVSVGDLQNATKGAGYDARSSDEAPSDKPSEVKALQRDVWTALVLTLPVFVLEMGGHMVPAFHHWVMATLGQSLSWTLQAILVALVLAGPGRRFFERGIPGLLRGAPDMNALVALGTAAAFGYSLVATFAPGVLPDEAVQVYYESAAVIVTLILLGRLLEARAKGRTGAAIRTLAGLQPDTALVVTDNGPKNVAIADIQTGDRIRLRPGERVAVDGTIVSGRSDIDESMLTGEPLPVAKAAGAFVSAGTNNGTGVIEVEVTGVGRDTRLAQIIHMVERAQGAKLPVQALVDRITLRFVPAVLAIAGLTVLIWLALGQGTAALVSGVAVLIIACPCAMGLATPTSIMVALGRAAQLGVLFRKGTALQQLEDVKLVVFDKTGTLTQGRPVVTDIAFHGEWRREELMPLVAAVEAQSEHPIARALVAAAGAAALPDAEAVHAHAGRGIVAQVEGRDVRVGRLAFVAETASLPDGWMDQATSMAQHGVTPVAVSVAGAAAALIAVSDPIREDAAQTVAALKQRGVAVAMLSGDAKGTAAHVADQLGIDHVFAECLPADKLTKLTELQTTFGATAFVGDGINDAPALAAADCGVALGNGTDVAIEAAEVVLSSGQLSSVVTALDASRRTMRNIRQNLGWAFGYNVLLIPVAAGLLVPFGGPQLSPALAAGAMAASSVLVLTNALRLRNLDPVLHDNQHG
nr:heavy metal translocating P-type ATPase [Tritonibacter litoralis]